MLKKNFFRIILSMLALCIFATALAGCGKSGSVMVDGEEVGKVPEEPYQIDWYTRAPAQADVETVENAVNEYLKDKLNVTLKFHILDAAQYQKKMSTMIAAGEKFDLAYCGSGQIAYADSVRTGAFYDMAQYVDTYMPDIKEQFDEGFFKTAYVDGKLGGIPCLKEYCAEWGWIYRTDIAEKYGIDMSKMKTLEDLEPYLEKIKAGEPEMEYPIEWDTSMQVHNLLGFFEIAPDIGVYLDNGVPRDEVVIFPESEEYKKLCETTKRYYEKGLVKPDVLTAKDAATRFKTGKSFCTIFSLKPDAYMEKFPDMEYPIDQVAFSANTMNRPHAAMIGLSATSENPVRTMRFLNLLYSDPVLSNMIVYGVEGVHYNLNKDGRVEQIADSGYDMYPYQYMLGNIFMNKLKVGEDEKKHEKLKAFNESAVYNPLNGFWVDTTDFELERVQLNSVVAEFRNQTTFGIFDYDEIYPKYEKKLKEAGIDRAYESVSAQVKTFMKENK